MHLSVRPLKTFDCSEIWEEMPFILLIKENGSSAFDPVTVLFALPRNRRLRFICPLSTRLSLYVTNSHNKVARFPNLRQNAPGMCWHMFYEALALICVCM